MQGMAMVIKVGDPRDFPTPPDYFPVCGSTMQDHRAGKSCRDDISAGVGLSVSHMMMCLMVLMATSRM